MNPLDFLASHAEAIGDKPAVICGGRSLDYAELSRRAGRFAGVLSALGCSPGDRVAWMSFNSIEGAEISNGLLRFGAVLVPVNYRLLPGEVAYVLGNSGAKVALAGPDHVDVMNEARAQVAGDVRFVAVGDRVPEGWLSYRSLMDGALPESGSSGGHTLSAMYYTSGTTGNPKGTWRPNGVDVPSVIQVIATFEISQSDVHLMCGPGHHSAVGFLSALHIVVGATVVIEPKFDADQALDLIERHRVTTTFMAPTLLQRLVEAQERRPRDVSSLRAILLGAAPCPFALKVRAHEVLGPVLWEFYGATETAINTVLRPEDQLRKPGSCGLPLPGHEVRIVRGDGTEAATGEPGELMVRSGWLAEYFGDRAATEGSMRDGFFSVGDVAYRDEEGYLYICDRRVDMIISGGVNIYPAEVEAVLHAHPAVMDAAVIGVPDEEFGESVKAVVSLGDGAVVSERELIDFCAERLAGYKKPRSIDFAGELPRDPAGKLLKRALRDRYWSGAGRRI